MGVNVSATLKSARPSHTSNGLYLLMKNAAALVIWKILVIELCQSSQCWHIFSPIRKITYVNVSADLLGNVWWGGKLSTGASYELGRRQSCSRWVWASRTRFSLRGWISSLATNTVSCCPCAIGSCHPLAGNHQVPDSEYLQVQKQSPQWWLKRSLEDQSSIKPHPNRTDDL